MKTEAKEPGSTRPESSAVEIRILLFATAREAAGVGSSTLRLLGPATAGSAFEALIERYPTLAPHQGSMRLAVNSEYVDSGHALKTGDELALIPPTCGG